MKRQKPAGSQRKAPNLALDSFQQPTAEEGLSLESLTAAFTGMLSSGEDPYTADEEEESLAEVLPGKADAAVAVEDRCEICPKTILEAMLFVGTPDNLALTSQQIAGLMRGVRPAEIDTLVRELNADYAARNCPYHIVDDGAGYRFMLRPAFNRLRDRFYGRIRTAKLSQAAVEVLALVAYQEPISAEQINKLRGKPSGPILAQMVRRELLKLLREPGEPARYFTTPRFLTLFGIQSLADLPRSDDLEPEGRPAETHSSEQ